MKIGFIYAGQGSQYVGMNQSYYDNYQEAKDLIDTIDPTIKQLCFQGPLEQLSQTRNTQPAMVCGAIIATKLLKKEGIIPTMTCGLSLGEYSALYCSGVFHEKQVMDLVTYRGQVMELAAKDIESKMVAVLGLDRALVEQALSKVTTGICEVANYNCPGQIVIGGQIEAVDQATIFLKELGARRVLPLNTSGPFHTSLLKEASLRLKEKFSTETFGTMDIPVVFNSTAKTLEDQDIALLLEKQVMTSVYFEDSIQTMINEGIDTFIEIGPGKVLSGFIKKINKDIPCYQVEDKESLEQTIAALKGAE